MPDVSAETEAKKDRMNEQAKKQHRTTLLFCKILSLLEKTLRQLRIHILKLDAKIFKLIQYLRDKSAKKLEDLNKLSYKSFSPSIEKKPNKPKLVAKPAVATGMDREVFFSKSETKPVSAEKMIFPPKSKASLPGKKALTIKTEAAKASDPEKKNQPLVLKSPVKIKPIVAVSHLQSVKNLDILGYPNKISAKVQYKIEERKLLHIIAKSPKNAENYKKLGMLYYENDNFLDAEAAFGEYIKLNSSDNEIKEILARLVLENHSRNNSATTD